MSHYIAVALSPVRMRMHRWMNRDRGASLVEYAFLIALIAIACLVAVVYFGQQGSESFSRAGTSVQNA